jgi:homoserine O-acetyltransferase
MASPTKYFTGGEHPNLDASPPSKNEALTLAYQLHGRPENPAVLIPSCFSGKISTTLSFLYDHENAPLKDYFVIVCGLLGGSESSSPSNSPAVISGSKFPPVSYEDNIELQHSLCQALGIQQLHAYIGFSMGGQQGYYMAIMHPQFVKRVVVLASSAKTSWHNKSFLEGPKAALVSSIDWKDGFYTEPARQGTRAFARVYSTWALSSAWFRQEKWEVLGCEGVEAYLDKFWNRGMGLWDAHDLLCMMQCWRRGDISDHGPVKGDLSAALASIKAKVLVMPSWTDLYFPPEDSYEEVAHLRDGKIKVIESVWGHLAGGEWGPKEDQAFIQTHVGQFLML